MGEVGLKPIVGSRGRGGEVLPVRSEVFREVAHHCLEVFRNDEVAVAKMQRMDSASDYLLLCLRAEQGLVRILVILLLSALVASNMDW